MEPSEKKTTKGNIISLKIYFDRARMYLGYINFFILNVVLLNSSKDSVIGAFIEENKLVMIPVLFIFYAVILIFIGYMDTRLGFRQEELRNNAVHNPVISEMRQSLGDIKDSIEEVKMSLNGRDSEIPDAEKRQEMRP